MTQKPFGEFAAGMLGYPQDFNQAIKEGLTNQLMPGMIWNIEKIDVPRGMRSDIKGYLENAYGVAKHYYNQSVAPISDISLETESSDALVEGYRVSGKTGTAEIPTPFGYTSTATNASYVGWGPTDDPQFLVYVWLEKPQSSVWGSIVAAPVFRQAVEKLVVLLNIPPDDVRRRLTSSNGPQQYPMAASTSILVILKKIYCNCRLCLL